MLDYIATVCRAVTQSSNLTIFRNMDSSRLSLNDSFLNKDNNK